MAKFRSSSKPLRTFKPKPRTIPAGKFTMAIESLAEDGRGVARIKGKTVFVAGALAGEQVKVSYQQAHKNFDEAVVIKVLEPSADRVEPACQYYSRCGGCNLQHLSLDGQRHHKQRSLAHKFSNISTGVVIDEPLLGEFLAYRHRARFAIKADRHNFHIGFRQTDSHQVVDITQCLVLKSSINAVFPAIKTQLSRLKSRSSLMELSVSEAEGGGLGLMLLAKQALCDADLSLLSQMADEQGFVLELYHFKGKEKHLQFTVGESELFYTLNHQQLTIPFTLSDFTQVNPEINQRLIDTAINWLQLNKADHLADYFCGIGNFTLPVSNQVASVTGYELVAGMVKKASHNAALNNISNAVFQVSNLMAGGINIPKNLNKVLLDPPRAGADVLCQQLAASSVEKILYISCNPKTLHRDAKTLVEGGYQLARIALADMFPQTSHSEVVALFTLAPSNSNNKKNK